jgi:hypothetical protein
MKYIKYVTVLLLLYIFFYSCIDSKNIFVPHLAPHFLFFFNVNASIIAYIHLVYDAGVQTNDFLVMSHLPLPLDHGYLP